MNDLEAIADPNNYSWIKVKQHLPAILKNELTYDALYDHHIKETKFLIELCRKLAKELINVRNTHTSDQGLSEVT